MKDEFLRLVGEIPQDPGNEFKHRLRVHQGWWRTAVLLEEPGPHPVTRERRICNTINVADGSKHKNFLTPEAYEAAEDAVGVHRSNAGAGIINEPRLWGNLVSSQPLCFNFWAPFKYHDGFADGFLGAIIPDFWDLIDIHFEWAPRPKAGYTGDNSAFDVMIEYRDGNGERVIWGLECKYTDSLGSKTYSTEAYMRIFEASRDIFVRDYDFYIQPSFNQLFRNQLMACAYEQKMGVKSYCGLFCSGDDAKALDIATRFQATLAKGEARFSILTYQDFITTAQRLAPDWETRRWTILLWARYLGLDLSEETYSAHRGR